LVFAPAVGAEDTVPREGRSTALPAWTQAFSRLPDEPTDESGRIDQWLGDPALARTFTLAVETTPAGPDWAGLARDTAFLIGYQAVAIGVIFLLPESVSGWSDDDKRDAGSQWVRNVQSPRFDNDGPVINYIFHPYFGATYFIRARERGLGEFSSFAYSALASALYEFGVEALFEKPSIQDLIVTPVGGALLGAFVFEPIRNRIKAKSELAWYDHVGLLVTDPIGAVNSVFERLLGIKSEIRVNVKPPSVARSADGSGRPHERTFGIEVSISLK
jgi:hypothetical protein